VSEFILIHGARTLSAVSALLPTRGGAKPLFSALGYEPRYTLRTRRRRRSCNWCNPRPGAMSTSCKGTRRKRQRGKVVPPGRNFSSWQASWPGGRRIRRARNCSNFALDCQTNCVDRLPVPTWIENVMGTVRRVCRNVKRWHSSSMAMRWTAAAMDEASKGFRSLKAHKRLVLVRKALLERQAKFALSNRVAQTAEAA
jgi:hypothetical protein